MKNATEQNSVHLSAEEGLDRLSELAAVLARMNDAGMIEAFLVELFTPAEQKDISSRWELVKRLDLGDSQRKIAADLGLSLCKITRGSRELKKKDSVFRTALALYREISEVQNATGRG